MSERTVVADQEPKPGVAGAGTAAGAPGERLGRRGGLAGYLDDFVAQLRSGELGALPVIVGLVVIVIVFQSLNSVFLSSGNLVNLAQSIPSTGIIAIGVVLVLLLGEIDLSVAAVSGAAGAVLAVLSANRGYSALVAVVLALAVGAAIGLLQGLVFTKLGVPSFVVTLAGLLIWQGLQLRVLGETGSVNLPVGEALQKFGQASFVLNSLGYALAVAVSALMFLSMLRQAQRRRAAGLAARPVTELAIRAGALLVLLVVVIYVLSQDRGVPWTLVLFLALVAVVDLVLRRTRYGRAIFAIGGNIEAARRAGINVDRVRTSVFVLTSTFAALGGIVAACYLGGVDQQFQGGDVLINSIAAAVIGGTSLFGGRGRALSALLGILVIGAIANGLLLVNLKQQDRYIITGVVLIASVVIDSLARRGRQSAGR
jgi:ABC-type xylose transport system permease subunit